VVLSPSKQKLFGSAGSSLCKAYQGFKNIHKLQLLTNFLKSIPVSRSRSRKESRHLSWFCTLQAKGKESEPHHFALKELDPEQRQNDADPQH
jgi:hypothetical protein